jgi:branched-chain amino acid transport system substrate-binding protein
MSLKRLHSRSVIVGSLVSVLALVSAACSKSTPGAQGAGAFKIGVISAETGFASSWGLPWQWIWKTAADEVNAQGGLDVGGKKYKVNILTADDKFDPTLGVSAAQKFLTRDGAKIIVSANDPTSGAILKLVAQNDAILLGAFYTDNLLKTDHSFGVINQYWQTADDYIAAIKQLHPDVKSIDLLNLNFDWGKAMGEAEQAAAQKAGLTWLGTDLLEAGVTDLGPAVSKVIAKHPDVFSIGCFGADQGTIIKTARDLGYTGVLASNCQADIADPLSKAGKAAEGYIQVEDSYYPPPPELATLRAQYEKSVGPWVGAVARYWYAPRALFAAIQKAGTVTDTKKIISALQAVTFKASLVPGDKTVVTGLPYQGDQQFPSKTQLLAPFVINVVENGTIKTIGVYQAT